MEENGKVFKPMSDVAPNSCPNGHSNQPSAKFCGTCGKKIELDINAPSSIQTPSPTSGDPLATTKSPDFCFVGVGEVGIKLVGTLRELVGSNMDNHAFLGFDSEFSSNFHKLRLPKQNVYKIGTDSQGTGHFWKMGEKLATESSPIKQILLDKGANHARAVAMLFALGGGMGSGGGPYLMSELSDWGIHGAKLALGVLPADDEPDQMHFNAYSGLARLIRYRQKYNCDMIILLNNSNLDRYRTVDRSGRELTDNEVIATICNMIATEGPAGTYTSININDLVTFERSMKAFHFAPFLSMSHSTRIYGSLTGVLESAFARPLMPFDRDTAVLSYLFLRISDSLREKMTYADLLSEYDAWRQQRLPANRVSYFGLSYTSDEMDKMDAMLLVGGHLLAPTINRSHEGYSRMKESSTVTPDELDVIDDIHRGYDHDLRTLYQRVQEGTGTSTGKPRQHKK
jgi:hypothetical protein